MTEGHELNGAGLATLACVILFFFSGGLDVMWF